MGETAPVFNCENERACLFVADSQFGSMKHTSLALVAAFTLVQACTELPTAPKTDPIIGDCGAENFQHLIGQTYALSNMTELPQPLRVIRPGQAVTMDYSAQRMNVDLDSSDVIARIYCG